MGNRTVENTRFSGFWMPAEIWLNPKLSKNEAILLAIIHTLDNENGCTASNGYFAKFFGVDNTHVSRMISKLVGLNLITREIKYKNGSKCVDVRYLRCNLELLLPTDKNINTLLINKSIPSPQKDQYPIDKNVKDIIKNNNKEDNKDISKSKKTDLPDYQFFFDKWNKAANHYGLSEIIKLTDIRKKKLKARLKNDNFQEKFISCLKLINKSKFLKGDNDKNWIITFDWLISNDSNWVKVIEGNYTDIKIENNKSKSHAKKQLPKITPEQTKKKLQKIMETKK